MAVENGIRPEDMNPDVSSVDVSVPQAPNFEGGAEVLQGPQGGAIVQALTDAMSNQEQTPQVPHDANLAELIEDGYRGEISTDLTASYQDCLLYTSDAADE